MNIIIADFEALWAKIKPELEAIGAEIWVIAKAVFTAEEAVIMSQLATMLKNDAVSLQNAQPGINSKQMGQILETNAQTALAGLGVQLAYTGIITTIGTVMKQLNVPDQTGNAGTVSQ